MPTAATAMPATATMPVPATIPARPAAELDAEAHYRRRRDIDGWRIGMGLAAAAQITGTGETDEATPYDTAPRAAATEHVDTGPAAMVSITADWVVGRFCRLRSLVTMAALAALADTRSAPAASARCFSRMVRSIHVRVSIEPARR